MRKIISTIIFVSLISFVLISCRKTEHYSEIPEIHYKDFLLRDTTDLLGNKGYAGILTFSFVDGDGDLGLKESDTLNSNNPKNSNLFFTLYTMKQGNLVEVDSTELEFPLSYRIPYLEPQGKDLALKGDIETVFLYVLFRYDTLQYKFYITDRAGHESNTETTPIIVLPPVL